MDQRNVVWRRTSIPVDEPIVNVEICAAYADLSSHSITSTPVYYLQGVRNGVLAAMGEECSKARQTQYLTARTQIIDSLVDILRSRNVKSATGLTPPSSRSDATPYFEAMIENGIIGNDVSYYVSRINSDFRAGSSKSLQEVRDSLEFSNVDVWNPISELLIVDDIIAGGRTAAAIILGFLEHGYLAENARVILVTPLLVRPSAPERVNPDGSGPNS